jgi:solute carrier family 25 phosphate transporter 23/24/25/41
VYDRLKMGRLQQLEREVAAAAARLVGREGRSRGGGGGGSGGGDGGGGGDAEGAPVRVEQGYMMLFGAIAGAISEFSTYPSEVVRRRMQLQGGTSSVSHVVGLKALRRMAVTLRVIIKRRGLGGLYVGCLPSCIQVLPSAALGYYSYEMFKVMLNVE